jgi:hypothetical protein
MLRIEECESFTSTPVAPASRAPSIAARTSRDISDR